MCTRGAASAEIVSDYSFVIVLALAWGSVMRGNIGTTGMVVLGAFLGIPFLLFVAFLIRWGGVIALVSLGVGGLVGSIHLFFAVRTWHRSRARASRRRAKEGG